MMKWMWIGDTSNSFTVLPFINFLFFIKMQNNIFCFHFQRVFLKFRFSIPECTEMCKGNFRILKIDRMHVELIGCKKQKSKRFIYFLKFG